jgi:hypothetical protein
MEGDAGNDLSAPIDANCPTIAPTIAVEPPSTPMPLKHISDFVARYEFLIQFINKPDALAVTDLWQGKLLLGEN